MVDAQSRVERIRDFNEKLRREMPHGTIKITGAVTQFSNDQLGQICEAIQAYDGFGPDDDPSDEHDVGTLEFEGVQLCWVIEAYDKSLAFESPDPLDGAVTSRILTIMLDKECRDLHGDRSRRRPGRAKSSRICNASPSWSANRRDRMVSF